VEPKLGIACMVYERDPGEHVRYRALERGRWHHGVQDIQGAVRVYTRWTVSLVVLSGRLSGCDTK
jgi:hypothetical protein